MQRLSIDPNDARALAMLGLCRVRRERYPEGRELLQRAVGLAPEEAYVHYWLGVATAADPFHAPRSRPRWWAGEWGPWKARLRDAVGHVESALALEPNTPAFHAFLSRLQMEMGALPAAEDAARRGLAVDADDTDCAEALTAVLERRGRLHHAELVSRRGLSASPDDAEMHRARGWLCLRRGEAAQATEHFRTALRIAPGDESGRLGLIEATRARWVPLRPLAAAMRWLDNLQYRPRLRWGLAFAAAGVGALLGGLLAGATGAALGPSIGMGAAAAWLAAVCAPLGALLLGAVMNGMLLFNADARFVLAPRDRALTVLCVGGVVWALSLSLAYWWGVGTGWVRGLGVAGLALGAVAGVVAAPEARRPVAWGLLVAGVGLAGAGWWVMSWPSTAVRHGAMGWLVLLSFMPLVWAARPEFGGQ